MKKQTITINIIGEKLFSNNNKAFQIENSKKIGEKKDNLITYSNYEALYLLENKESELIKNNKKLNFEQAVKLFTKETKDFFIKYLVFKELRKKGYIVKAGLKFGGEFRVYEQYNLNHAKYICFIAKNSSKIIWQDLISKIRVTHSTAKKLLIAIVDSEDDLLFYEMDWIKL